VNTFTATELSERFAPVLASIADTALDREADRRLPYDEVNALRDSGFTKLRVPQEFGGLGVTLPQFTRLLIELGRADSNLPQLLRGHFGFVESRLAHPDPVGRERWLRRVAEGVIVGNAQSELGNASFWQNATRVTRDGDQWRLTGRKFYSTGSLLADWIHTTASLDEHRSADVLVPTSLRGVSQFDDWDGFGQRLTASGTTLFEDVPIHPEDVEIYDNGRVRPSTLAAFFQLVHLATLSGIARAAVDDAAAFVRQRQRNLVNPAYPSPKDDPLVQQVIGRITSAAYAAEATTLATAQAIEDATDRGLDHADVAVYSAQGVVIDLVLGVATELCEVGGASAVTERFRLDRHWRNARTLASHNPVIYRHRLVGDFVLNGVSPNTAFARSWDQRREERP